MFTWKVRTQANRLARSGEFASASLGSRAFVVAAGPAVNLLFGILVYWAVFAIGLDRDATRLIGGLTGMPLGEAEAVQIGWVADNGPGAAGGLMPGDILVSVNGDSIRPTFFYIPDPHTHKCP